VTLLLTAWAVALGVAMVGAVVTAFALPPEKL